MVYAARYFKPFAGTQQVIGTGAVTSEKILPGAVDSLQIKDKGIQSADIADGAVLLRHLGPDVPAVGIPDGSITEDKLANDSVSAAKIKTGAVTSTEIGAGAVTVLKLGDAAVETVKIKDGNVTTPKIADGSVTPAKLSFIPSSFVPRSPAVWDLQSANFTRDGNWHVDGMDLSSIVPVGAIAIALQIEYAQTTSDSYLQFRQNDTKLPIRLNNQVGIQINSFNVIMPIDADRLIDYAVNDSLDVVIGVAVLGWWI